MPRFFLLFLCCSIISVPVFTQTGIRHHIEQFTTENGLPSNGIKGLQWDKQTGFLWIATEAGMVRYNGMEFKTYTSGDDSHISNERILFLVRNNTGTIYTADNTGNLFSVNKNRLSFIEKKFISNNPRSNVMTLGISDIFYNTRREISTGQFPVQFIRVMPVNDTAAYIWLAARLYYFSISMNGPQQIKLPIQTIPQAFKTGGEIFIADTVNNIWRVDKGDHHLSKTDLHFDIGPDKGKSVFLWENGMELPLLLNGSKIWKIVFANGKLSAELISDQIPLDVLIRYAQYDEFMGTLFLGADSKGLIILKKDRIEQLRKNRTTISERTSYYSQLELPDGNILTNEGHLLGKNDPEKSSVPFTGGFSVSTFMQGDSLFWTMMRGADITSFCLHSYNLKTHQLKAYPRIRNIYSQLAITYSGGHLYMVGEPGIYRLEGDSLRTLHTYPSVSTPRIHFDLKEIKPGLLGMATCNALLTYDIRANKVDTVFSSENYCVRTLWQYKDYTFFGTYGNGLYISRNGKTKALPLDKNRHLLYTHCFIEDDNGYCWISTNRGLFKASIAEMINAYETNAAQVYYHYFGRNDGMDMTEMNGGCMPCGLTMKNKTISFPTMEGLLWVEPGKAMPRLPDGEIFIDEIKVDNRQIELSVLEKEKLSPSKHDILVRLGFAAWCNKENVYLQYRLNDKGDWKPVNIDNGAVIELNNLSSGDYILKIRKLNGFGVNNYSYKEIHFSIPRPWNQQWWFYLLSLAAAGGIIVMYFRYRTNQFKLRQHKLEKQVAEKTKELQEQNEILEKNNSIKTRLISIISHDIVTPLKFVTVAGNRLLEKREVMPEVLQQETIKEMTNTSQELQLLSTNILNWIKYQNENRRMVKETFDLHEMVKQVFGILQSLAKQKGLIINNEVPADMPLYQYYEPVKILVYNLMTNAIQFTEKGSISVNAARENWFITVSVKDEGIGMTPEQIQRLMAEEVVITSANVDNKRGHGLGFLIIKDLVKTMEASLTIESKKDGGTTISVRIPAAKNGGN
ncbi:MAG: hypothetical protein HOP10_03910 [Chitinophagaceae bacterium]|nr:hypothetical protein [Chitinophagaceae bacterium]